MKKCLFILISMIVLSVYSQNKPLLYGVDDLPQSLLLNPGANYNYNGFVGIPLFSGLSVSGGSSGVSAWDIFRPGNDINTQLDGVIRDLDNKDVFTVNQQLEIFSVGWLGSNKEVFYSAGMYQETDFVFYFPKNFVSLAYDGNADFIDRSFEFSDISLAAELLSVYHFGVNKKVSKKLRLGARAKLYMSAANINSTNNQGFFRTRSTPEGPNFFTHEVVRGNVGVSSSGLAGIIDNDEGVSSIVSNLLVSPNRGLGLDIGGSYDISNQLSLSASFIDVGFISHRDNLKTFRAFGSHALDGIELEFPDIQEGQETIDYWNQLVTGVLDDFSAGDVDDLDVILEQEYTTWRPFKFNAAINYAFGSGFKGECNCRNQSRIQYDSQLGFHINTIKRPRSILAAATLYYDKDWWPFFKTKISYTVDAFSRKNVGLLVSTKIKNFNLYLAADNLLDYNDVTKARQLSMQMGMQLVFNPE